MGFTPCCDYKPTNAFNADSAGVYTSDKILKLSTLIKIHLKRDVIDGSVVNRMRKPKKYSFNLDKTTAYKLFCEPETFLYTKKNKSVLNTLTFYIEDNEGKEVNFSQETLTFTLQMIEI